ncbi:MAG TPA: hypothetical protein VGF14_06880 [Alphaproteobacteria bacterium]
MWRKSLYLASAMALTAMTCQRKSSCATDDENIIRKVHQELYDAREKTFFCFTDHSDSLEQAAHDRIVDPVFQEKHKSHIDAFWNNLYYTDDSGKRHKINYQKAPRYE